VSDSSGRSPARTLDAFPFRTYDKLRYADTDRQGHVNNAVFATFLETGRAEFLYDPAHPLAAPGAAFVIASLSLAFQAEVTWPGQVDIGTGVTRVGTSSLALHQGVFQDGRPVAAADTVIVQVHDETRRAHPLTDTARGFLERHLLA
jgi:acyl-CoA thioester hydrolase